MTMNLSGASICDEELLQGEARDIQLPNTEHISQISVDVSDCVCYRKVLDPLPLDILVIMIIQQLGSITQITEY
jgi:hypothetical protein